ncbi:arf-GAP domain and FG repeat-containing protein 1a isoform X5 [Cynoglossus semilaevis]|uniref:arf-GAP domain and FG repeat-containing protein 1a isoform X5 n=1 Tax=Cynoglossus semilaevis TaxID=244447 RepID=UPI000D625F05|nr:arf-GAP domain and FG repeat-containing protein 1-like isoform X5 [Cynoglossus semilaevis]
MAASAKRKQEEKHLKMLREMTSLPPNRKCFDCDQRGPTYANMTVGSFVCTSCSGILRGLNPPHRVKSISMTTFTQQEIDFLQKHGNEVCKQIWLGLYDDRTSSVPDFREPQKVKEFLQEKYEKKRWYVPPEQAKTVASVHASISGSSNSSTSSTPEVRPLKSLMGDSVPALHLSKHTPPNQSPVTNRGQTHHHHHHHQQQQQQQQFQDKKFDLLSDLGGDIFAAQPNVNASTNSGFANFAHFNNHTSSASGGLANVNFANFDNFHKSCSAEFGAFGASSQGNSTGAGGVQGTGFPADRYAALADLDNMFGSGKTEQGSIPGTVSLATAPEVAAAPQQQPAVPAGGDRYAALAQLDTVFAPPPESANNVYNTCGTSQSGLFGSEAAVSKAPAQPPLPGMAQGFETQPTNPFVAAGVALSVAPTNPFQSNGRAAAAAAASASASFGTGSMSMPAGFGNAAAYNLPTSFSGTFQQPYPGQAPYPQPPVYPQQHNGGGFPTFGQAKPLVTPFGQPVGGTMVQSNPFLGVAPPAQYPAGGSSTNPFL